MRLTKLKVRARLSWGFGALVVLGLGVAGFGAYQLTSIDAQSARANAFSTNIVRVMDAARDLEAVGRAEVRYRLDGSEAALKSARETAARAGQLLADAAKDGIIEERRRVFSSIRDSIDTHLKSVDQFAALTAAASEKRTKLFNSGEDLTDATDDLFNRARSSLDYATNAAANARRAKSFGGDDSGGADKTLLVAEERTGLEATATSAAAEVEREVLLVQIAGWHFLATGDRKGPDTFKARLDKATAAMETLAGFADPDVKQLIQPAQDALTQYAADFAAYSDVELKSIDVYEQQLRPQLAAMQAQLDTTKTALGKDFAASISDTQTMVSDTKHVQLALAGGAMLLGIILAIVIGRGIVRPLTAMTGVMTRLAKGETSVDVPFRDGTDEIGDMGRAVEVFKQNMIETSRLAAEQEEARAAKEERAMHLASLVAGFQADIGGMVNHLSSASTELEATAHAMSDTAANASNQAATVAAAAEQAGAGVQSVAAATEELASSVAEISRQVAHSARMTNEAVEEARRTDDIVRNLAGGARQIGQVVDLIKTVAGQTNLLALNATIEAARAGEAGKGFAVVASEVKNLAAQTAKATDEIGQQVTQIQQSTEHAVAAIEGIVRRIEEVSGISTSIASAVEEQGAATSEIARNVQQTARNTQDVTNNVAGVSRAANDTGAATSQVLSAASDLARQAEQITAGVDSFIQGVNAA